jgi:predicted nucleic acid-binding Zn ribbon protein
MSDDDDPVLTPEGPEPAPVGALLSGLAARRGWAARLEGAQVHARWQEIAGDQLARHAEPVRLHGGVLVVRVRSTAWATQLRFLGARLVARANAVLGQGQVTRLTVVVGELGRNQLPRNPP